MNKTAHNSSPYQTYLIGLILAILVFRVVALLISPLELHGDEAQYWAWSKDLDWGYFTKPPMIAWVIATTTTIFGDAEWAIRISSPILHSITAFMIYRTARFAYDSQTGFWAAIIYLTMPALWLSSSIVSTDVSLLLCWVIALNAWLHLRTKATWPRAVQLGLAIGLGIMSKYAMFFFLPPLIIAMLFDPASRRGLLNLKGLMTVALTALIVMPNIVWNMQHDFATVTHTAANANIQNTLPFHPSELARFLGDQFGVYGPITFSLLIIAIHATIKGRLSSPSMWLAWFVLSPLLIICLQALMSRANANWAVTAYVAAPILTAHYCLLHFEKFKRWLLIGVGLNALFGISAAIISLSPAVTNAVGAANAVKHLRAWPETVETVKTRFDAGHEGQSFTTVALDKRIIFYSLNYYGLSDNLPMKMWMYRAHPENHAELKQALTAQDGPVLILNYHDHYQDELEQDFEQLIELEPIDIDLGGGKRRELKLWAGYGYTPTTTR